MKLLTELRCKKSVEKVEARTGHDGEIWERGSDSAVTLPPLTPAVGPSRPRADTGGHGEARSVSGRAGPGRAAPAPVAISGRRRRRARVPAAMALRCLLLLLCGAALGPAVHLDFAEHRSQAAKIKVNPRGNLWATGTGRGAQGPPALPCAEPPDPSRAGGCWQCHHGQGEASAGVKAPTPASLGSRSNILSRLTSPASLGRRFSIPEWHLCNPRDAVSRNREGSFPKIPCAVRTWGFWVSLDTLSWFGH